MNPAPTGSAVKAGWNSQIGSPFALELRDIGRTFGYLTALDSINFNVLSGGRRAVLGANGAGKTTLFDAITGDFPPTSGSILFFGEDITRLPTHERIRRGLRRTYQKSLLFKGLAVRDNLYLAVRGTMDARFSFLRPSRSDLAVAQAEELAHFVKLGANLLTPVGNLSHGQQRQLEIGMVMAGAPRMILLDEPAAGLSPAERVGLVEILTGLPEHLTYIVIEHDLDIALKISDRVTVLNNGKMFREGTPDEIRSDPDVQAIYLGERN